MGPPGGQPFPGNGSYNEVGTNPKRLPGGGTAGCHHLAIFGAIGKRGRQGEPGIPIRRVPEFASVARIRPLPERRFPTVSTAKSGRWLAKTIWPVVGLGSLDWGRNSP